MNAQSITNKLEAIEKGVSLVNKNWRIFFRALLIPVAAYLLIANLSQLVIQSTVAIVVVTILFQLAFTIIAVTTHRMVILGPESVSSWGLNPIGWREIKFLLSQYVIFLFLIPLALLFFIPFIGPLAAIVIGAYMVGRMSLVFPSIAIGRKFDFKDSWDATRNHQLMMFLTVAIFPFVIGLLDMMLTHIPGIAYLLQLLSMVTSVWVIAALSFAYQIVMQEKGSG